MIRLGVVGYGHRLSNFVRDSLNPLAREGVQVVGVVDPDPEGVSQRLAEEDRDARFFDSVADLVSQGNPDALMIGTRCNLHTPYAIQAAEYPLPLFLEKPVAISFEQARELETAFAKSTTPVLVSFPLRVSPLCSLANRLIADGAVGTPHHILAVNYVPYGTVYWERHYRNYETSGGLFLQKATHDLDYVMELMGSPIVRVSATAHYGGIFGGDEPEDLWCSACDRRVTCPESPENRRRNRSGGTTQDHPCVFSRAAGTPETGTNEDSSSALLEFASGAHGVYTQVFYSRRDAAARGARISGYQGTLDFDWYRGDLIRVRHLEPYTDTIRAAEGMSHFGGDEELARNFLRMIEAGDASAADMRAGLRSVYACLAARESAGTGQSVEVIVPG